jgi:hypothetical protein
VADPSPRQAQLRRFLIHLGIYFVATLVLLGTNLRFAPDNPVTIWPLFAWGVLVALHGARIVFAK